MSRVKLIHHVNVQITDRQRAREWYENVLGCTFLDRGPQLNERQLQLNIGTGEVHFTDTSQPIPAPRIHFAVEVDNWDEMLAHLDELSVEYSRTEGGRIGVQSGGDDPSQGRREDSGEHYTYIHDPDGNLIELVCHPRGLQDPDGNRVELVEHPGGLHWGQIPGQPHLSSRVKSS